MMEEFQDAWKNTNGHLMLCQSYRRELSIIKPTFFSNSNLLPPHYIKHYLPLLETAGLSNYPDPHLDQPAPPHRRGEKDHWWLTVRSQTVSQVQGINLESTKPSSSEHSICTCELTPKSQKHFRISQRWRHLHRRWCKDTGQRTKT